MKDTQTLLPLEMNSEAQNQKKQRSLFSFPQALPSAGVPRQVLCAEVQSPIQKAACYLPTRVGEFTLLVSVHPEAAPTEIFLNYRFPHVSTNSPEVHAVSQAPPGLATLEFKPSQL